MGRYLRKKRKGPFWKVVATVFCVLLLVAAGAVGLVWSKLDKIMYADEIEDESQELASQAGAFVSEPAFPQEEDYVVDVGGLENLQSAATIPDSKVVENKKVMNILLIGTDERTTHYNKNARADSMILVSINKEKNTVRLVSLERGIGVPILEGEYEGEYDLLTHIFRWGGAELLVKTVEHCFKVDVDHYVRLNFAAVEKIVDAVGGIDIELNAAEVDGINLWKSKDAPYVSVGKNHVNGEVALSYARLRWIDSDWQRVGRQRKVILATVDALKGSSLIQLNNLADTVLPLIQTNLTKLEIAELILYAPNFLKAEFDQMTIPKQGTYGGMSIRNGGGAFAVDYEINNDLLYRFLYEGVSSQELLSE